MPAPAAIQKLIDRFREHADLYRDPDYKEARLRQEFLDPFMATLGWDVGNLQSYSEAYKEVVVEEALKVEGSSRAPDYAFRVGGATQYYLEAKKPSVNLKDNPEPALQLRRYAWTKGLSVSLLSDFEELALYDTRIKPQVGDQSRKARLHYWTVDQYAEKWDEIAGLLSKEAILHGALDRFVSGKGSRTGTAEVDDAFLEDIENWRAILAKEVHKQHPTLALHPLNFAVQRIIDRIVFLRICEDRGIERIGRLKDVAARRDVYSGLLDIFRDADDRYNSGLFHFQKEKGRSETPDDVTPGLTIDDKPLKSIINSLYPPISPYAFSVLPADILGNVYERFLGKVILIDGRGISIEEKPEVRKAGGVYYTPTYVVDHIVRVTVGPHFEGETPKKVGGIRLLDPACGSGSFLI
jgi:hypothetical protein